MEIDWFTFWAQVLNFLFLVFLLHRFLYGPVMSAIERREDRIRRRQAEAEMNLERARGMVERQQEERASLEETREKRLQEVERKAERLGRELEAQVREKAARSRRRWQRTVRRQQATLLTELRERISEHAIRTSRELLRQLADARLEHQVTRKLTRQLSELDAEEAEQLAEAVRNAGGKVTLVSGFELRAEERDALEEAVRTLVDREIQLELETSPDQIAGIEIRAGDRKIGWSVGDRLDEAEREVAELLEAEHANGEATEWLAGAVEEEDEP